MRTLGSGVASACVAYTARLPQVGILSFISSLVGSLAWPAAAIVLGLIFKKQLGATFTNLAERMKDLTHLKAPGTELSFGERVRQANAELQPAIDSAPHTSGRPLGSADGATKHALPSVADSGPGQASTRPQASDLYARYDMRARNIAEVSYKAAPEVTVLNAWSLLDDAIHELASLMGVKDLGSFARLTSVVITTLDRAGCLPRAEHTQRAVQELLRLRLSVTSGQSLTRIEAANYMDTAFEAAQMLISAYQAYSNGRVKSVAMATDDGRSVPDTPG
jgi:hypothetical protein